MKLSAPMCRDSEAAAPFLPWEAQGGFVCAALKVPMTCRTLLKGTECRETFCSASADYLQGCRGCFSFITY